MPHGWFVGHNLAKALQNIPFEEPSMPLFSCRSLTSKSIHIDCFHETYPGPWFNIKMSSYQYRKSHCWDKMVVRLSYIHNEISYTGKMASLYWFNPLVWIDWTVDWTLLFHFNGTQIKCAYTVSEYKLCHILCLHCLSKTAWWKSKRCKILIYHILAACLVSS